MIGRFSVTLFIWAFLSLSSEARATSDFHCVGSGADVGFELGRGLIGIFRVHVGGKAWSRYPDQGPPTHLPLRRRMTRVGNTSILHTYTDRLTGEEVMSLRFDDVRPADTFSGRGVLSIKDEGAWQVRCSGE